MNLDVVIIWLWFQRTCKLCTRKNTHTRKIKINHKKFGNKERGTTGDCTIEINVHPFNSRKMVIYVNLDFVIVVLGVTLLDEIH